MFYSILEKKPTRNHQIHADSKTICEDMYFVLTYYRFNNSFTFQDNSNKLHIKVIINDLYRIYLNNDPEATVDLILYGPGLLPELSYEGMLAEVLPLVPDVKT